MMNKYNTIPEMLEARAQQTHAANLQCGGVFDADGNRTSNLAHERRCVGTKPAYVSRELALLTIGVELSDGVLFARYLPRFGYVEGGKS
jgi:hypothetical protein